ncbi:MAG: hypothetical protein ACOCRK_03965 [bacterium]
MLTYKTVDSCQKGMCISTIIIAFISFFLIIINPVLTVILSLEGILIGVVALKKRGNNVFIGIILNLMALIISINLLL